MCVRERVSVYVYMCVYERERERERWTSRSYHVQVLHLMSVYVMYKEERERERKGERERIFYGIVVNTLSLSLLSTTSLGSVRPIIRTYYTRMFQVLKSCQCFTLAIW